MIVVVAEKPSVARELAAVLGALERRDGYFEGRGYQVTWAVGHLVRLAQPDEIRPAWRTWSRALLPIVPSEFPLVVLERTKAQYRVVERLLNRAETKAVIAATDAGREGELIFRSIYEHAGCTKPWQRLWLSSLTEPAIRAAFSKLEPSEHYDALGRAARARSCADWLIGMNLSRAYTLTAGTLFSVGRVQTPTLAMVVERDRAIREVVSEPYLELKAEFEGRAGRFEGTFYACAVEALRDDKGKIRAFKPELERLPPDGVLARAISERTKGATARVIALEREPRNTPAPMLYDLGELQRHANRLFGYSAQRTLDLAQALYEQKLLSYPRTDSRHLSAAVAATLPRVVRAIASRYQGLVPPGAGDRALGKRFVDDSKVTDHHALIPTAQPASIDPNSDEGKIYDLVCRRLLMAWHEPRVESVVRVVTATHSATRQPDLFVTAATTVESAGWSVLDVRVKRDDRDDADRPSAMVPVALAQGDDMRVVRTHLTRKQTQPPKPFTDATLLTAMATAGRALDEETLVEVMRGAGLGTPATRAATLETLIARGYLVRRKKSVTSTDAGAALVHAVHPLVKSAEMTARWEEHLLRIERHGEDAGMFMRQVEAYVREVVALEATKPQAAPQRRQVQAPRRRGSARSSESSRRRRSGRRSERALRSR